MVRTILIFGSILCAALIAFITFDSAEGVVNVSVVLFLLWDFLPLLLVVILALLWRRVANGSSAWNVAAGTFLLTYCFVSLSVTACVFGDFLYYMKTADHVSSTSALVFVFYPVEIVIAGLTAAAIVSPIAFFIRHHHLAAGTGLPA
jgi:hypothetical protein